MSDETSIGREHTLGVLDDVDRLRARVRSDRRATSVPLLALGALAAATAWDQPWLSGPVVTTVAGLVLLGLATHQHRRERSVGVGTEAHWWTAAGLSVLVAYVLVPWLAMLLLPPVAIVGIVVAVMGGRTRIGALVAGGIAAALVSGLEQWFVLSNRVWDVASRLDAAPTTWVVVHAHELVLATLAVALLVSGAVALHRERRRG